MEMNCWQECSNSPGNKAFYSFLFNAKSASLPYINRFLQPDSIIPDLSNPQSWNRFSYVTNRPVNFNDPTGHRLDDGCSTVGCSLSQSQKDQDAQKLALLEEENHKRKCRNGNKNYCVQMDEWAWDNIPSTIVVMKGGSLQGGFGGEFGGFAEVGYALNWRSFEHEKIYTQGRYGYLGTPQMGALGLYKGISFVYGASSISSLQGDSRGAGFTASLDSGGTVNSAYSSSIAVNADGVRLIDRDSSRPIQSHQVTLGIGVNGIPNVADAGGLLIDETTTIGQPESGLARFFYNLFSIIP